MQVKYHKQLRVNSFVYLRSSRKQETEGEASFRAHLADMNADTRRQARGRWLLVGVGVAVMAVVVAWTLSLR
jgi:hypothetical protein